MTLIMINYALLVLFGICFSIWFYTMVKNPKPFFEGGLDLKNDSNDRLLIATMILWIIIMIITLMR